MTVHKPRKPDRLAKGHLPVRPTVLNADTILVEVADPRCQQGSGPRLPGSREEPAFLVERQPGELGDVWMVTEVPPLIYPMLSIEAWLRRVKRRDAQGFQTLCQALRTVLPQWTIKAIIDDVETIE